MIKGTRVASNLAIWRRLLGELHSYWVQIAGVLILNLAAVPLSLLVPLPLKIVVDSVIGTKPLPRFIMALAPHAWSEGNTANLLVAILILITVAFLTHVIALGAWVLQAYTGERITLEFRARLFERAQRISLDHHDRKTTTDSLYRIQSDAPALQSLALNGLIPIATGAVTIGSMLYVIARIDPMLAALALITVPVLYLLTTFSRQRLRKHWMEYKNLESGAMSIVHEVLGALRTVKAFGREAAERGRFFARSRPLISTQVELGLVEGGFDLLIGLTLAVGTATVLWLGVSKVVGGVLTLGNLLVVMSYLAQLYRPLETISRKIAELQSSMVSTQRAWTLLDAAQDVPESPVPRPLSRARGEVHFENVSFQFPGSDRVLHDVSFSIAACSRVGIVGVTGAGKTTILSLLMRFYDPDCGRILLDDVDIRAYSLADLRRQIALVLQEPVLFSTTIAENIAYGRPEASLAEIEAAARTANAHDFISKLPDQYDSQVGERGLRLSGGERQRISLARAFLKDAPLLVLDEPTSAIDAATEAAIIESLDQLMCGRTVFIITHRPTALRNCELVLRLDRGRIVEVTTVHAFVKENAAR
jgi:ATP-binding cassette, subfamily B, bacterial